MNTLDLDIELARGDFRLVIREALDLSGITAVFGPSGSGKTSLLRVLAGLEPAAQGRVAFRDQTWLGAGRCLAPEARAIGFVFQDGRLFAHLSVRGNLEYPLRHGRGEGPLRLADVVEAFELDGMLDRYPASLSGGEQQRVSIARALLANPALLLMDEPLSSLDLGRKNELIPLIKTLPGRFGIPVLYVTHDVDELVQLADEVLLLSEGRSVARGSPRTILERSDFERVAELADPGAVLEARVTGHGPTLTTVTLVAESPFALVAEAPVAQVSQQPPATPVATEQAAPSPALLLRIPRIAAEVGAPVRLLVHARDVVLALEQPTGLSIRNSLAATIETLLPRAGGQVDVVLEVADQRLRARITGEAAEELGLAAGQPVLALIKTVALA